MLQLAQLLPTEENFLLCFREFVGSSSEFMAVSLCFFSLSDYKLSLISTGLGKNGGGLKIAWPL